MRKPLPALRRFRAALPSPGSKICPAPGRTGPDLISAASPAMLRQ
jgi:hypothetical protein